MDARRSGAAVDERAAGEQAADEHASSDELEETLEDSEGDEFDETGDEVDEVDADPSPLLTATQVAERMKRTRSAVYDRVYRGQMPGVLYIGRSVFFRKVEILPWLAKWEQDHPEEFPS